MAQSRAKGIVRSVLLGLAATAAGSHALATRCSVALFACVNIVLVHACLFYYAEARKGLIIPYSILLFLLGLILCLNALPSLGKTATADLSRFRVSTEVLLSGVVVIGFLRGVAGLASEFTVGTGLYAAEEYPFLMLFLAFADLAHGTAKSRLKRAQVYSISDLVPNLRMPLLQANESDGTGQGGGEQTVAIAELLQKQRVALRSGEIVPADGIVVSGQADVAERRNSFAQRAAFKSPGSEIYAGSEIREGSVIMQTVAPPENSDISGYFERMRDAVRKAPSLLREAAHVEPALQGVVLAAALGAALFWLGRGSSFLDVTSLLIAVLVFTVVARDSKELASPFRAVYSVLARRGVYMDDPGKVFPRLRQVRNVLVDYSFMDPIGRRGLFECKLLDARIDDQALWSVVLSLFASSGSRTHEEAAQLILETKPAARLREVTNVRLLPEGGISGSIENTRFLFGTESALIAEKVLFEPGDTGQEREDAYYLAIERHPVAHLAFAPPLVIEGMLLKERLDAVGVRFILAGTEAEEKLDKLGKEMGLELSSIQGGLSASGLRERVRAAKPLAFVLNPNTPADAAPEAEVGISRFDEHSWDFAKSDIVVFGGGLTELPSCILLVRREAFLRKLWLYTGAAVLALGGAAGVACALPGVVAGGLVSLWSLLPYAVARSLPVR